MDMQGWNSKKPLFDQLIEAVQPKVIIEDGVWKAASLIHMLECCAKRGLRPLAYAVDVFYGLAGMEFGDVPRDTQIPRNWNRPTMYQQFLYTIKGAGFSAQVIPVVNFSQFASHILGTWGVKACLIYIDADHSEDAVYKDIMQYWNLLRAGGVMFGDDFGGYDGVPLAVKRASDKIGVPFSVQDEQWLMPKP